MQLDLQWAEPRGGVHTDLDAYLFNESAEVVSKYAKGEGDLDNIEVQQPIEVLGWKNETTSPQNVFLVINRCEGACNPRPGSKARRG